MRQALASCRVLWAMVRARHGNPERERGGVRLCHSGPEAQLRADALLLRIPESASYLRTKGGSTVRTRARVRRGIFPATRSVHVDGLQSLGHHSHKLITTTFNLNAELPVRRPGYDGCDLVTVGRARETADLPLEPCPDPSEDRLVLLLHPVSFELPGFQAVAGDEEVELHTHDTLLNGEWLIPRH